MLHAQFIINVQECHVAFSENRDTVRTRGERRTKRENVKNRKTVQQFFKLRAVCALISGKWKGQERERERDKQTDRGGRVGEHEREHARRFCVKFTLLRTIAATLPRLKQLFVPSLGPRGALASVNAIISTRAN